MSKNNAISRYVNEKSSLLHFRFRRDGKLIHANAAVCALYGENPAGKNFSELIIDFHNLISLENLVKSDKSHLLTLNIPDSLPQTYNFVFTSNSEAIDAFGEMDYKEIELLKKTLFSTNMELTNTGRELHKKNAELEKINVLKNQFLGMAAHDLRTPIGNIASLSDIILEDAKEALNEESSSLLVTIKSLSELMLQMINDLLDISAIESGKLMLKMETISLSDLAKRAISLHRFSAGKKNISLRFDCCENIPSISIDPFKIEQVLNNLLTNAIKFSYPDTETIIAIREREGKLILSVQDQGQGIPGKDLEKLFKPFSKTSVKSTAGESSTGLGLVIVKKIVNAHGGRVWVESEVNKGTAFYVELPL